MNALALIRFLFVLILSRVAATGDEKFTPDWPSLDSRPLPSWYDESKIGIFLHWGVFSVPSFKGAWFWEWWKGPKSRRKKEVENFMKENYPPSYTYQDFAKDFTAQLFKPLEWANIFAASGARYVVLTAKHHEGYCNWPTKVSWNWNSIDVGPRRDLVGELANAIREATDLKFGIYHSLYEFFNPLLEDDYKNRFHTQNFVKAKALPELYELVERYKPHILWSDGQWKGTDRYWNSTDFLAWLYNDSPVKDFVVTNDRWGSNTVCKHGGYVTCKDHFNPKKLWPRKFEDSTTMTKTGWSFQRQLNLSGIHTPEKIIELIAQVVSCGGNIIINVGPTKEGMIAPIYEERLRQMGAWLKINGESIYATKPWTFQNDLKNEHVWYTMKQKKKTKDVFAILLKWPTTNEFVLGYPIADVNKTKVDLLGYIGSKTFAWKPAESGTGIKIAIPILGINEIPCRWAWVFKLTNIIN